MQTLNWNLHLSIPNRRKKPSVAAQVSQRGRGQIPRCNALMLHFCLLPLSPHSDSSGLSDTSLLQSMLPFASTRSGEDLLPFGKHQGLQPLVLLAQGSSEFPLSFRTPSQGGGTVVLCRLSLQPSHWKGNVPSPPPPTGDHHMWPHPPLQTLRMHLNPKSSVADAVINSLVLPHSPCSPQAAVCADPKGIRQNCPSSVTTRSPASAQQDCQPSLSRQSAVNCRLHDSGEPTGVSRLHGTCHLAVGWITCHGTRALL